MCWSAKISAGFACFDVVSIVILWVRNAQNDRLYAKTFWPIAFQETAQITLWKTIGKEPNTCSLTNQYISLLMRIVVAILPYLATISIVNHLPKYRSKQEEKLISWFVRLAEIFLLTNIALFSYSFAMNPIGTIVGPNHHQIWPQYYQYYGLPKIIENCTYIFFAVVTPLLFIRPFWKILGMTLPMGLAFMWSYIKYPLEYESIWCWSGAIIFVWLLLLPKIQFHFCTVIKAKSIPKVSV